MATPGTTLVFSFLLPAIIPANPPKSAIKASNKVGVVLASSSDCSSFNGVNKKYIVEVNKATPAAIPKLLNYLFSKVKSFVPTDKPIPKMGPIKGEINIAPITTAVLFTFNPIEAIKIEHINM